MPTPTPSGVYLRPGSTVYQLRIGVPKDLQNYFRDPKTGKPKADAYRASLRTSNREEAITRALKLIADYRERFAAMRAKAAPAPFVALTPALVAYIAGETRRLVLQADENAMFYSDDTEQRDLARSAFAVARRQSLEVLQGGDLEIAQQYAERIRKDAVLPEGALEGSHKFRHWLRSTLAEKHVGEATMDSITGHTAQGSSGRKTYTAASSLTTMREALDRINWPRVSQ
ncbi:hypothetical protein KDW55_28505 [Burkholderia sp. AU19243]|uniref:DUF6538 domain-containing protein n=1 Tax=Burkholderia sp. AU19243 TaxID=2824810 RepID=UPI001BA1BD26|nr:DUF6538 domain-containing protein [Burkholderia sp. AU19243]MBR8367267.1 hypothetical protein [Burkholderia sp. AU19243]